MVHRTCYTPQVIRAGRSTLVIRCHIYIYIRAVFISLINSSATLQTKKVRKIFYQITFSLNA